MSSLLILLLLLLLFMFPGTAVLLVGAILWFGLR
jgi:hypothetical protein